MLYAKPKKEALAIHERAVSKYNVAFQKMERLGGHLYEKRCDCVTLLHEIEFLVNSIANRPKEFEKKISEIQAEQKKFQETKAYAAEAMEAAVKSGISVASGTAGGVATAKWVATIFGTESTGAALWPVWHLLPLCGWLRPLGRPPPEPQSPHYLAQLRQRQHWLGWAVEHCLPVERELQVVKLFWP